MWFSPTEILNRFVSSKRLTFSQETIGQCAHICCVLFPHHSIGHPGIIGIPKNHRTAHSSDNLAIDHRSNERIHLPLIHTTALIGRRHDLDHGGINHPRSSPYNFVKMYNIKLMVSSERPTQQRTQKQCDRFWDHQRTNVWCWVFKQKSHLTCSTNEGNDVANHLTEQSKSAIDFSWLARWAVIFDGEMRISAHIWVFT